MTARTHGRIGGLGLLTAAMLLAGLAITDPAGAAGGPGTEPHPAHLKFTGVPKHITVTATGPTGAVVTYPTPQATEKNTTTRLPVTCTPASGSTFPVGKTKVVCTATDTAADPAQRTASFEVTVRPAHPGHQHPKSGHHKKKPHNDRRD